MIKSGGGGILVWKCWQKLLILKQKSGQIFGLFKYCWWRENTEEIYNFNFYKKVEYFFWPDKQNQKHDGELAKKKRIRILRKNEVLFLALIPRYAQKSVKTMVQVVQAKNLLYTWEIKKIPYCSVFFALWKQVVILITEINNSFFRVSKKNADAFWSRKNVQVYVWFF